MENVLFMKAPTGANASQEQLEAGNYKKIHKVIRGLRLTIENPKGSVRRGIDPDGHEWKTKMHCAYGYVKRSMGVDGDHVDVYVGPDEDAEFVYVVHQRKAGDWKKYDEDKAMVFFSTEKKARAAYLRQYDDKRFLGPITKMPFEEFKKKVYATKDKPAMIKGQILFLKGSPLGAPWASDKLWNHVYDYKKLLEAGKSPEEALNGIGFDYRLQTDEVAWFFANLLSYGVEFPDVRVNKNWMSRDLAEMTIESAGRAFKEYQPVDPAQSVVCLDFDGVLHSYSSGWQGSDVIPDPPVEFAGDAVKRLRKRYKVVVNSARCADEKGRKAVAAYLAKHNIVVDEVCEHKPAAIAYVDDLGVPFQGDWDKVINRIDELGGGL